MLIKILDFVLIHNLVYSVFKLPVHMSHFLSDSKFINSDKILNKNYLSE